MVFLCMSFNLNLVVVWLSVLVSVDGRLILSCSCRMVFVRALSKSRRRLICFIVKVWLRIDMLVVCLLCLISVFVNCLCGVSLMLCDWCLTVSAFCLSTILSFAGRR